MSRDKNQIQQKQKDSFIACMEKNLPKFEAREKIDPNDLPKIERVVIKKNYTMEGIWQVPYLYLGFYDEKQTPVDFFL